MKRNDVIRYITYTALMCACTYVGTILGFSSPQFYFNLGDSVILITAALLGPIPAMIAGGLGSFLADLTVFPATMLFTLVIKAVEGLVAGILFKLIFRLERTMLKKAQPSAEQSSDASEAPKEELPPSVKRRISAIKITLSVLASLFATGLMMCGYFISQTFIYGTYASALIALPMDAAQAAISSAAANIILYLFHLIRLAPKFSSRKDPS